MQTTRIAIIHFICSIKYAKQSTSLLKPCNAKSNGYVKLSSFRILTTYRETEDEFFSGTPECWDQVIYEVMGSLRLIPYYIYHEFVPLNQCNTWGGSNNCLMRTVIYKLNVDILQNKKVKKTKNAYRSSLQANKRRKT